MIQAGRLRHNITVEQPPTTLDSFGQQPVTGWTTVVRLKARIEPLSGRELQLAKELHADVTHRITVYYYSGLRPDMRIVFGTRTFHVLSILNVEEVNRWMQVFCKEIVG